MIKINGIALPLTLRERLELNSYRIAILLFEAGGNRAAAETERELLQEREGTLLLRYTGVRQTREN